VLYSAYDSNSNRVVVMLDRKSRASELTRLARTSARLPLSITLNKYCHRACLRIGAYDPSQHRL